MTTAIDTNVFVALWNRHDTLNLSAAEVLGRVYREGRLSICSPVFAELLAAPGRTGPMLDSMLQDAGVRIDWNMDEAIWRTAGAAYAAYARHRRRSAGAPRRILADFIIGAHAAVRGYRLLTLDDRFFRSRFPGLKVVAVE